MVTATPSRQLTNLQLQSRDPQSLLYISETDLLRLIHDDFVEELSRLKRAHSIRTSGWTPPLTPSPSRILYGREYDEVNRTLVGILSLRWIYCNQYTTFTNPQPPGARLSVASFSWLRTIFTTALHGTQSRTILYALITSIVINDLGKDPQLARDTQVVTGDDISSMNHDMILFKAVEAGLVRCLDRLPEDDQIVLVRGIMLGSELNFGQLAQAESPPRCLLCLQRVVREGDDDTFRLRFMEQLLDVAGAAGHMDWSGGVKLTEPVFHAYRNVYDAAMGILAGTLSLKDGYDMVLVRRGEMLRLAGFRALNIKDSIDRALLRVLCMGGAADVETACLYDAAWMALETSVRTCLIQGLNIDGSVEDPAVQPTYMPALLCQTVSSEGSRLMGQAARQKSLQAALRFLSRVMAAPGRVPESATIIERSVVRVLKEVIPTAEFRANPDILDAVPVPKSHVAMLA